MALLVERNVWKPHINLQNLVFHISRHHMHCIWGAQLNGVTHKKSTCGNTPKVVKFCRKTTDVATLVSFGSIGLRGLEKHDIRHLAQKITRNRWLPEGLLQGVYWYTGCSIDCSFITGEITRSMKDALISLGKIFERLKKIYTQYFDGLLWNKCLIIWKWSAQRLKLLL